MSIVLVTFPAAPLPDAEAIQRESELEAMLERRITGKQLLLLAELFLLEIGDVVL